jgi:RsiW-degrading membrane proteinase PrsW (M82 family)
MTVRCVALLFAIAVVLLIGCGAPPSGQRTPGLFAHALAGTDDVELTYEIDGPAPPIRPASFGEDLRALVLRRLGAGTIAADVTDDAGHDGRRVSIVVDEALGPRLDELVTWTGTLLVLDPDPAVRLAPRDAESGLSAHEEGPEQWFEGSRADVLRAIETWPIDGEHLVVAEPVFSSTERRGHEWGRWRTRVVHAAPLGELGDGALVGWGDGPAIRVRGTPGSPAAAIIVNAQERRTRPILARGRISLGTPAISDDSMRLSFGSGAEAYARAQLELHLLATPRLPALRRVGAIGLPPNRVLALACLVVPLLLSFGWLAFVRRFDRAHPEPIWLVGLTFFFGAMATAPAALAEYVLASASPWLDPSLVTFGGQSFAFPLALVVFIVVVGLSEEGAKRLAAQFAIQRPEFDEPVDGIVYAIVASLGFAAAENIRYFAIGRMNAPLVIARCFMSVPAHMFFGALWGYALGAKLVDPRTRTWGWLLLAAACHGLFDALLSTEGAGLFAIALNLGLASAFVVLVRRALRHGVVAEEMLAIRPEDRVLFRVGRPAMFWFSSALLHVLALGIFFLGAYYQLARHRPSAVFVVGSSIMLAMLAIAALGVSSSLPLDVAIDEYGVTFAGAARSWGKIRSFHVEVDRIEIDCEGGPILLGPAPSSVIEGIAVQLSKRLSGDGRHRARTLESVTDERRS